jgi:hypothetical protein
MLLLDLLPRLSFAETQNTRRRPADQTKTLPPQMRLGHQPLEIAAMYLAFTPNSA